MTLTPITTNYLIKIPSCKEGTDPKMHAIQTLYLAGCFVFFSCPSFLFHLLPPSLLALVNITGVQVSGSISLLLQFPLEPPIQKQK